ncbi:TetR/AcrR family transcriptional regulator C-terminal domain-containing protein [Saccharothrix sp. 6-C]|uniref:TetR/AcrR family transcriptional regulator C-terminal domain-containing protein n=1 Tax=Saccharothrix sp. 6-C TaxID=2781735 RepID=UPI0019173467|nr:TetR/AcrR family transcriptional regulator C-terminal domain-containing protein [Saccharothrix sp. 6-C]QQQ79584.1 TetR/AcrR family transcriptional regulator C-terminal domain-containing protein [Saccharothrix sp. 6-C]
MTDPQPPYLRIVADVERRIADGELRPGDPVPTTRAIMREWGVAMATATKALAALKQAGAIESTSRVGAVVARRRLPSRSTGGLDHDRVVRVAMGIADADGLAALSARAVAAKLGVATVALREHLDADLPQLIADAAFAEIEYPQPPPGWRSHLRVAARLQWAAYQRHPWLPRLVSIVRPATLPGLLAYAEWTLRALDDLGLDQRTRLHVYAALVNHVRGTALNIESEAGAELDTGMTSRQWMTARLAVDGPLIAHIARVAEPGADVDLESLFDFGLERLLDGLTAVLTPRKIHR